MLRLVWGQKAFTLNVAHSLLSWHGNRSTMHKEMYVATDLWGSRGVGLDPAPHLCQGYLQTGQGGWQKPPEVCLMTQTQISNIMNPECETLIVDVRAAHTDQPKVSEVFFLG